MNDAGNSHANGCDPMCVINNGDMRIPENTTYWPNVVSMQSQHLRRWPNIKTML